MSPENSFEFSGVGVEVLVWWNVLGAPQSLNGILWLSLTTFESAVSVGLPAQRVKIKKERKHPPENRKPCLFDFSGGFFYLSWMAGKLQHDPDAFSFYPTQLYITNIFTRTQT